jgi:glycosyltransferase involved in cell wall biosynthesis
MKILQIGSNSVHVSSYLLAMKNFDNETYLLTEEKCDFDGVISNCIISFRSLNPLNIWKANKELKAYLQELKPDVIHIHQVNRLAYFVTRIAEKLNIPVVTTAWGSDVLLIPKQNAFFHFLVKQTLKRSAFVTADSKDMIFAMNQIVESQKYILVQYGIDPIRSDEKEKVIFSNRLHEPLYRIDSIINYFNDFQKKNPDWKLIVAGSGSETEKLKDQVGHLGLTENVQKEENRNWYSKATIYISIPESDGTSVSVLEAMSAGCIPVVADLPVSQEWITSGKNGIIEQIGVNPLFDALLLDSKECSEINKKLIESKATRSASMNVFFELYKKAIYGK